MSQNVVPSVATGDIMTAANWNLQVRDNINGLNVGTTEGDIAYWSGAAQLARLAIGDALKALGVNAGGVAPEWVASLQSLLTAQGDLIIASAANTPGRLAKGTARQLLSMNAGVTAQEWVSHLDLCVLSGSSESIATGVPEFIDWDTEEVDDLNWHDSGSNPSRITVDANGWYMVGTNGSWEVDANGFRVIQLWVDGGFETQIDKPRADSVLNLYSAIGGYLLYLTSGQYLEIKVSQDSGSPLSFTPAKFSVMRIR